MAFAKIDPKEITDNPFKLIGDDWALLSAGVAEKCNTMTVSWGGVGVIWGGPAAVAYVRQTRYTKEFMDANDLFTLSFFDEDQRQALALCGRVSGRDCDKVAQAGLTPVNLDGVATFEQARLVLVCRKQFVSFMDPESFVDKAVLDKWYADQNYHTQYIGAIEAAYVRE